MRENGWSTSTFCPELSVMAVAACPKGASSASSRGRSARIGKLGRRNVFIGGGFGPNQSLGRQVFQQMLFSKIVPNCKKLGLLDAGDGWLRVPGNPRTTPRDGKPLSDPADATALAEYLDAGMYDARVTADVEGVISRVEIITQGVVSGER